MLKQMIIAGSGYGTRMSDSVNRRHTKSLIYVFGRTLLDIQIDWAIQAGIKSFCISVKPEDHDEVTTICAKYEADFIFRTGEKSFSEVPSIFEDLLDDHFIFVGGHTPVLPTHLTKMIIAAESYDYVVSAYDNMKNIICKKERIMVKRKDGHEKYILIYESDDLPQNHFYLKNPYVINKGIVMQTKMHNFIKTPLFYIFKEYKKGSSVISISNDFPVEFNTDIEFIRTKNALRKYLE